MKARRGFSLVEILISIIILGLGLLGLGALFPVVIRQQRISTDQTLGVMVAESARSKLVSGVLAPSDLWRLYGTTAESPLGAGWGLGVGYNWSTGASSNQRYEHGEWYLPPQPGVPPQKLVLEDDVRVNRNLRRGASWVGDPRDPDLQLPIPLVERFYPADSDTPQFVWDFALQRVGDGVKGSSPDLDPIRLAVFVRRIDPRIRVAPNKTLRQMLLAENGVSSAEQKSPFGEDSQGQPTLDGTDGGAGNYTYSQVRSEPVEFYFDPSVPTQTYRNRLYVPSSVQANVYALMKQPNQRLVDNLGNIYTVINDGTESGVGSGRYLKIEPPVPAAITEQQAQGNGNADRVAIREVAFTAQIPVHVMTVEVAR